MIQKKLYFKERRSISVQRLVRSFGTKIQKDRHPVTINTKVTLLIFKKKIFFSVSLRNRLISGGLEPVLIVLYPVFYEYKNVQT